MKIWKFNIKLGWKAPYTFADLKKELMLRWQITKWLGK